jgi:hypothetical protein
MGLFWECPVQDCKRSRKNEHLMCWPHWRRVPRFMQRAVWDTCAEWSRGGGEDARSRYDQAANAAIAEVERKEISEAA